ncbi:MAG: hypothetical protein RR055_04600 [Oscillospiraceae bacterium]
MREFAGLAEGLSPAELERVAQKLLAELEGGAKARVLADFPEPPAAPAARGGAVLPAFAQKTRQIEDADLGEIERRAEAALSENSRSAAFLGTAAENPAERGRRGGGASRREPAEREPFHGATADAASGADTESISEAVRRDSRRYDPRFQRY